MESGVRSYCRSWPTTFVEAQGWTMTDDRGRAYLDCFAGAGALNYGHNHPAMVERLVEHLRSGGIVHGLDMATDTKEEFLERFDEVILRPRSLDYKVQFPGPTGTNAVEAALKLARKVTGRDRIVGFTNAFHGMTLGALSVTGNSMKRRGAGVPLSNADSMPFAGFLGDEADTIAYIDAFLGGDGSGVDIPAAMIIETTQGEGGLNVASASWLRSLATMCREHNVLLIVDDIQVGCGRTGPFFSFEEMGFTPDIVCLSKSLSGLGLPMAVTLMRPELDVWGPGEHNGTFRGNNAAFVTATTALEVFWRDDQLQRDVRRRSSMLEAGLTGIVDAHPGHFVEVAGTGLIQGLRCVDPELGSAIGRAAFERGLLVETAGPADEVLKLLPPLVIDDAELGRAIDIVAESVDAAIRSTDAEVLVETAS